MACAAASPRAGGPARHRRRARQPSQLRHIAAVWLASRFSKQTVKFFVANFNKEDLQTLADMLESGELKPAIDRTYELAEAQDALRTFGEGHVRGKLVLTI